ncbi:collagen-like triple helix repeat-containing protein [Chroococcidiopsis thermalis]|uniref:collagen-like triple helix repeat-containing protein n=1 Tax=Chroococcidiopsis thermalis TaxID=54299 RepID=UPI0002EA2BFD|nr:collagen-like protein [Chroococcidiopsis thermalis]
MRDRGDRGDKGDKGDRGDRGDKGDKGDRGDKGEKTYTLHPTSHTPHPTPFLHPPLKKETSKVYELQFYTVCRIQVSTKRDKKQV